MADETTPPAPPEQRSWAPETGWPSVTPAATWAEVEGTDDTSDEEELDAWLDAQDEQGADDAVSQDAIAVPGTEAGVADALPPQQMVPVPGTTGAAPELRTDEPLPEEHGSDQGAAAVAGAALFTPLPLDLVNAQPGAAHDLDAAQPEALDDLDAAQPEALDDLDAAQPEALDDLDAAQPEASAHLDEPVLAEPPDEPAVPPQEPAVAGRRSGTVLVAALAVLVLVLAGLTGFLAQRSVSTRGGGGAEDARHDALQAARGAARLVFSYDYRHLDKDFAAGKAVTTGAFADQYGSTTPKLIDVAKSYKAVVVADVSDAAVISATPTKVVVLVFVNQQSTSTLAAAPKITQSRVTMTLVHQRARWLVSDVHAF